MAHAEATAAPRSETLEATESLEEGEDDDEAEEAEAEAEAEEEEVLEPFPDAPGGQGGVEEEELPVALRCRRARADPLQADARPSMSIEWAGPRSDETCQARSAGSRAACVRARVRACGRCASMCVECVRACE